VTKHDRVPLLFFWPRSKDVMACLAEMSLAWQPFIEARALLIV